MKAIDIYKTGVILSGIGGDDEHLITGKEETPILFFINKVMLDLKQKPIESINQNISLTDSIADAAGAGIAYYLALSASFSDRIAFLTDMYNAKRSSALSSIKTVKNTYPVI